MRMMTVTAAFGATFLLFSQSAQARAQHQHRRVAHEPAHYHELAHYYAGSRAYASAYASNAADRVPVYTYASKAGHSGYGARPAAWCGWEMRHLVSSDPGPDYNLARNWAHWGRSGPPGVGAVVVWPHHVGKIVGKEGGMWVIESGNDGHATRTRARPIGGAIAIRWG
jgi:hypothetical protein